MCSLLVGDYCAIDYGDASGMNALDIRSKEWLDLRSFVGDDLLFEKLGKCIILTLFLELGKSEPAHKVAGKISNFFVERYGFSQDCLVINFSGNTLSVTY
jgi:xylulokinase